MTKKETVKQATATTQKKSVPAVAQDVSVEAVRRLVAKLKEEGPKK